MVIHSAKRLNRYLSDRFLWGKKLQGSIINRKVIFSLPIFLLLALLVLPASILPGHAFITGTVCIADSSSNNCPSSLPAFTGATGSQLTVAINVQGSDSLFGFEIRVKTDTSVLNPSSVAVEGNIMSTSSQGVFWYGCINGTPTNSSIPSGCQSPT